MIGMQAVPFLRVSFFLFLAYVPWYGAEKFGERTLVQGLEGIGVTYPGLYNILFTSLLSVVILRELLPIWSRRRPVFYELSFVAMILLTVLNVQVFDADYFISIENTFFLSVIFVAILNRDTLRSKLSGLEQWGVVCLSGSYFLALTIPLLFPIAPYFRFYGDVRRYVGWLGLPTFIGFLGMACSVWGAYLFKDAITKTFRLIGIGAIVIGYWGIYLAVHRISMAGLGIFFVTMAVQAWRFKDTANIKPMLGFATIALILFCSGNMALKSQFKFSNFFSMGSFESMTTNPSNFIEDSLQTNGRMLVNKSMWEYSRGHRLLGLGTGAASRHLRQIGHVFGGQPHNDYLRMFIDHGIVGLLLFLTCGFSALYSLRNSYYFALVFAFSACLLTDNLLVYPLCGSGPLLLSCLAPEKKPK